ncbi:MAG: sigma-70 family RNA polymerase sigma factor [Planctomycetes bacterium]|nr:sigma-70 family RNA polymerase sigma factor [Planctomycetota bacterium]
MNHSTDADLVRRCLEQHPDPSPAFDLLYQRHAGALLMFLYGLHRHDEHAARDALQETFLRFWSTLPGLDPARELRPWLLRVARNVSLDALKRFASKLERGGVRLEEDLHAAQGPAPHDEAAAREDGALLRRAVLDLPSDQRAVFLLRHDQGLTFPEIAAALGCAERTAKYRMRAALDRLAVVAERLGVQA